MASEHNMYVMQGIGMTKDSIRYYDDEYKNKMREEVRLLAETFKNDTSLLAWGIGNEIELGNANIAAAWNFVEELAQLIKSIDKRHLVSTVISYNPSALDSVAKYAPSLDYVGINVYGPMGEVQMVVDKSDYKGAFMITEWGPTGWWETASTEWKAPIEQTSEEKRQVYEERYTQYISANPRCLGSFVFLWGQKEERTPTWFSMFVEDTVDMLPLKGEKTPMVEAMQRVWTGKELDETAPVILGMMTVNGKSAIDNVRIKAGASLKAEVAAIDKENDSLTYVWEVLKEATVLGFGGSYEPRPERVGEVAMSDKMCMRLQLKFPENIVCTYMYLIIRLCLNSKYSISSNRLKMKTMKMLSACLLLLPFISCTQVQDTKNDAVIEQKIEALLSRMTLEEKIGQMNQISSYGNIEDMSGLIKKGEVGLS